jgi:hypothetical protein
MKYMLRLVDADSSLRIENKPEFLSRKAEGSYAGGRRNTVFYSLKSDRS